ncbi:MAG: hypothetical protein KJ970_19210 [Candidatus Eisenbacteria bacterium]|uniref:Uncharacterized protein n=1 Tax=Eiseniibacteriota bacterium TaxID=2212470 RepID=A0A948RXW0_UNCEI|nr:hypothetical protein [Candidatus Eisenbacteria bacterium]MBU1949657.1 hypothetical protein [Candidatus Eisenbacteria bacterium]MBU2693050.1 hypothetical protein [Candidatus Eisenbacteria bacterium]
MMNGIERFKPAVSKGVLIFLAGTAWMGVGLLLMAFALTWLSAISRQTALIFLGIGLLIAIPVARFGLSRIAEKNLKRILPMEDRRCLFAFMTWKSYTIILIMVGMGITLRHSAIPKPYLAIFYSGMGMALILSSMKYLRSLSGRV